MWGTSDSTLDKQKWGIVTGLLHTVGRRELLPPQHTPVPDAVVLQNVSGRRGLQSITHGGQDSSSTHPAPESAFREVISCRLLHAQKLLPSTSPEENETQNGDIPCL